MELFNNKNLKQNQNELIIKGKKNSLKYLKILLFYFTIIFLKENFIYKYKSIKIRTINNSILIPFNKYYINNYLKNYIFFNITSFSFKFNIAKIEYNITFYDENDNIIYPFDLLLNDFRVICNSKINNTNLNINSLANIYNKYFSCIEFFNLNEIIDVGINIYHIHEKSNYSNFYFILENSFNYNDLIYENNNIFDPLVINNEYNSLLNKINDKLINDTFKLKKSYIRYPNCILKRNIIMNESEWKFKNIYNHYFCFCNGLNCLDLNVTEKCKFNFYINIIDNNRNIYPKTDYCHFLNNLA